MISRRHLLQSGSALAAAAALPAGSILAAPSAATRLLIERRVIEVNREPASVFAIRQTNGRHGIVLEPDERFRVVLENRAGLSTLVHWHGQTPPPEQDGVPGISQPPLQAGQSYAYDFQARPGTHWMHSHEGLHEQLLMAAPLIVREPDRPDAQEVVLLLHDFSFSDAAELFAKLGSGLGGHGAHGAPPAADDPAAYPNVSARGSARTASDPHAGHGAPNASSKQNASAKPPPAHLHDVEYDAYLANDRTLDDPEVVRVDRAGRLRLRIINAATATAFVIDTGVLAAKAIAVDGNAIVPFEGRRFPLAMAQRIDLLLNLPRETRAWPIFAQREGDRPRTGIVLATHNASVTKVAGRAKRKVPAVGLAMEQRLRARAPLAPRVHDRELTVVLGEQPPYIWTLNGATFDGRKPLTVHRGERVQLTFENPTSMMHPMHLHGHHFQVVALGDKKIAGAIRDTVIVPARGGKVTVIFDADNPGEWMLHCHNLYHMAAGMMTTVKYEG